MSKLTLSVDPAVVARAKRYASRRGTSVSRLVEEYLELISRTRSGDEESTTPVLRQLRAELEGMSGDISHYRRHLERKYR